MHHSVRSVGSQAGRRAHGAHRGEVVVEQHLHLLHHLHNELVQREQHVAVGACTRPRRGRPVGRRTRVRLHCRAAHAARPAALAAPAPRARAQQNDTPPRAPHRLGGRMTQQQLLPVALGSRDARSVQATQQRPPPPTPQPEGLREARRHCCTALHCCLTAPGALRALTLTCPTAPRTCGTPTLTHTRRRLGPAAPGGGAHPAARARRPRTAPGPASRR